MTTENTPTEALPEQPSTEDSSHTLPLPTEPSHVDQESGQETPTQQLHSASPDSHQDTTTAPTVTPNEADAPDTAGLAPDPNHRVWTAHSITPTDPRDLPEEPAQGIRVGQLVWASVVCLTGVFLIILALCKAVDIAVLLIGLIGVLGVVLIISAFFVDRRPKPPTSSQPTPSTSL
ncbi:hypothetical protein G7Y41_01905 [Schaalia sp. ZJ405]|uniref:hypothetical protein n=1 Tax=Schaalia sp. ZJ405 TaxID=2709403 RepID=UPI0013EB6B1E|nr:hypothetical protein [Schaalia sp. ZJ405]QPK81623.1 hypothetical protein G7Y41_01905 [Schaalia sp. ZJ405]